MRTAFVVIDAPSFDRRPRVKDCREGVFVEELVANSAVEALDGRVLVGFARLNEVQIERSQRAPT